MQAVSMIDAAQVGHGEKDKGSRQTVWKKINIDKYRWNGNKYNEIKENKGGHNGNKETESKKDKSKGEWGRGREQKQKQDKLFIGITHLVIFLVVVSSDKLRLLIIHTITNLRHSSLLNVIDRPPIAPQ